MTLGELRERVSSAELTAWFAYYRLDPWGEQRADLRNAMSMRQVAAIHRDPKRSPRPPSVEDFMPYMRKPKPRDLTADEFRDKWRATFGR